MIGVLIMIVRHYILSLVEGKTLIPESLSGSKEIVLNLSPQSIQNLYIDEEGISFKGRFNGKLFNIFLPLSSVLGIYAKKVEMEFFLTKIKSYLLKIGIKIKVNR